MILLLSLMTGLMAGIYFAFSFIVVQALNLLPESDGAKAMNSINDLIVKTIFLPLFFISSLSYVGLLIWSLFISDASYPYFVWASVIYIVGMFGVTAIFNVPLNNRLKDSEDNPNNLKNTWEIYRRNWVALNHLRLVSCITAFMLIGFQTS